MKELRCFLNHVNDGRIFTEFVPIFNAIRKEAIVVHFNSRERGYDVWAYVVVVSIFDFHRSDRVWKPRVRPSYVREIG